jgi:energy-converting hydrogenase A subunit Q
VSASHEEDEFEEDVTGLLEDEIKGMVDGGLEIDDIGEIIEKTNPKREKTVIDENCIACGVCVDQCPVNCIKLQAPLPIHITEGCVFCGRCVEACPFDAVSITEEHFATRDGRIYFSREKIKGPRKGEIVVDYDSCQQCEVCVNRCPEDALSFQDDKLTVDTDRCIRCAECEGVCPLHAIKFKAEN